MTNTRTGIFLFILAWTFIPVMDGIAKHLSASLPVLQIVWARYFFTCVLVFPILVSFYKKHSFQWYNFQVKIFCKIFREFAVSIFKKSLKNPT